MPADGKANLAADVEECSSDVGLQQLVEHMDIGLIRPVLAVGGQTKPMSPEDSIENLLSEIDGPIMRVQQRLRTQCLSRDGYCCVITKAHEETASIYLRHFFLLQLYVSVSLRVHMHDELAACVCFATVVNQLYCHSPSDIVQGDNRSPERYICQL